MKDFKNVLMRGAIFILLLTLGISCSSTRRSISIEEGWDLLGEQKVNFVRDRDGIKVFSNTAYTAIRFKVENREVRINELNVVYQNGDKLNPAIDDVVAADQYSKIIELTPEGKIIRSVDFSYRTTGNVLRGRANVLVFGKRYVQPAY